MRPPSVVGGRGRFCALLFALVAVTLMLVLTPAGFAVAQEEPPEGLDGTNLPQNGGGGELDGGIPEEVAPEGTTPEETTPSTETTSAPGPEDMEQEPEDEDDEAGWFERKAVDMFKSMLTWAFETAVGDGIEEVRANIKDAAFGLPQPSAELVGFYEDVAAVIRPVVLLALLLLGVSMMIDHANYSVAHASQSAFPKIVYTAVAISFFPTIMAMLIDLSSGIADGFVGEAAMAGATDKILVGATSWGVTESILSKLAMIGVVIVGFMVMLVSALKNVMFTFLYVVGPVAIAMRIIPGVGSIAGTWLRGIMSCAIIPVLYSLEVMVGSWLVTAPEAVLPGNSNANSLAPFIALGVLWIMWKTPFKVMAWAFGSSSSNMVSIVKTVIKASKGGGGGGKP